MEAKLDSDGDVLLCSFEVMRQGIKYNEVVKVYFNDADYLMCACKSTQTWCAHLQEVMTGSYDAPLLANLGSRVMVPIVPSDNIFAQIAFTDHKVTGELNVRKVVLIDRSEMQSGTFVTECSLGFIFEGESLWSLRDMVLAWFYANKNNSLMFYQACTYNNHNSYTKYGGGKNYVEKPFTREWKIAHTGLCGACTELSNSMEVPDV